MSYSLYFLVTILGSIQWIFLKMFAYVMQKKRICINTSMGLKKPVGLKTIHHIILHNITAINCNEIYGNTSCMLIHSRHAEHSCTCRQKKKTSIATDTLATRSASRPENRNTKPDGKNTHKTRKNTHVLNVEIHTTSCASLYQCF